MSDKHYCWAKDCTEEIPEPQTCCSGRECGCMGLPIDPPFCIEHMKEVFDKKKSWDELVYGTKEKGEHVAIELEI